MPSSTRRAAGLAVLLLTFLTKAPLGSQEIESLLPPLRGLPLDAEVRSPYEREKWPAVDPGAEKAVFLIAQALSWLGTPYLLGGMTKKGADCSGFLYQAIASSFGADPNLGPIPRRSEDFASFGFPLPQDAKIEPGDILLFSREGRVYHVGLALGGQAFIHSASEGARTGVILSYLWEGNWSRAFQGARRLYRE
ncbi:MAG: NlpC/P60 family protein [Spirochaetota bacterium]